MSAYLIKRSRLLGAATGRRQIRIVSALTAELVTTASIVGSLC
jgi:hypothetical protein